MRAVDYQLKFSHNDSWIMDRPHFHEEVEILLSLSSSGDFFVAGELYPIRRGALFLFSEGTLHKSVTHMPDEAEEAYNRYVFHIAPAELAELSTPQSNFVRQSREMGRRGVVLQEEKLQEILQLLQQLERPAAAGFGGDVDRTVVLLNFLLTVFGCFTTDAERPVSNNPDFARVVPILEYIQHNLAASITLDGLAGRFFINKFHMCHSFKAATGFGIMEYVVHCRVLKARELLRQGLRVQEVGERVGFQNNAHFIRTFGAITGTSPKQYAKAYLLGERS